MKILKEDNEGITLTKVIPENILIGNEIQDIFDIYDVENISENIIFTIRGKKRNIDIGLFTNTGLLSKKAKEVFDHIGANIKYCSASIQFSKDPLLINHDYYYFSIPTKCSVVDLEKTTSYKTWADDGIPKIPLYVYLDGSSVECGKNGQPIFEPNRVYVPILYSLEGLVLNTDIKQDMHIMYALENVPIRPLISDKLAKAILDADLKGIEIIEAEGYNGI